MRETLALNVAVLTACLDEWVPQVVYVGTACSYNRRRQSNDTGVNVLDEAALLPAAPETGYGWAARCWDTLCWAAVFESCGCTTCTVPAWRSAAVRSSLTWYCEHCVATRVATSRYAVRSAVAPLSALRCGTRTYARAHLARCCWHRVVWLSSCSRWSSTEAATSTDTSCLLQTRRRLLWLRCRRPRRSGRRAAAVAGGTGAAVPFGMGVPTTVAALVATIMDAATVDPPAASVKAGVRQRKAVVSTAIAPDVWVPSGDFGRVCDTTASASLGWRPTVSLPRGVQGLASASCHCLLLSRSPLFLSVHGGCARACPAI